MSDELNAAAHSKRVWINFIPNIDLGHLLAMLTFLGGLAAQWNIMDRRLTIAEEHAKRLEAQIVETRANNRDNYLELKVDVKEVKQSLGEIQRTLAVTNFMANQQQNVRK